MSGNPFLETCKFDVDIGSAPIPSALLNDVSNLLRKAFFEVCLSLNPFFSFFIPHFVVTRLACNKCYSGGGPYKRFGLLHFVRVTKFI